MSFLSKQHNNIKLYLILLLILTYTIFYYLITTDRDKRIDLELENRLYDLQIHHDLTLNYFYTDAKSIQSMVTNDPVAINLLKNSYKATLDQQAVNREKLYNYLLPYYKRIQTRGVLQFQFMFPDNTTFLRVHKPSKFNDDLSEIRYSYKYTNETKKVSFGFEQGKTTHSIRYVFPIFDEKKKHIGAAEVALSTNFIQNKLITSSKIHTHYIVDKKIFEVRAWKAKGVAAKYIKSVEHDDYIYVASSHLFAKKVRENEEKYIASKKEFIAEKFKTKEPFTLYICYEGKTKVLAFEPVKNIKEKKVVAYIVSHTDSKKIQTILDDSKKILLTGLIAFTLFFYFFYKLLIHRETLQHEVNLKTKKLRVLNENLEIKIAKEVEKNKKAQEQIYRSEKMAALGEMIGNIAHQWRQPLSVISTAISGVKLEQELGTLTDERITQAYEAINDNTQYLSKTIDDFRDYIKDTRVKKEFVLNDTINSFLHLIEGIIKEDNLNVIVNSKETITLHGYPNELIQTLLNIFNNSKDAVLNLDEKRYIFIDTSVKKQKVVIVIKDNGGGVDEDILSRIFEPYYTTKHKSQGTGLGLSITYNMVTSMGGSIEAINTSYSYEDKEFTGLETTITLPLE